MSSRSTPPPQKGSYSPTNDAATYRELLLFEERLKTNAATLYRRKSRYQLFLAQLLVIIAFLVSEVVLQTSFLTIPYKFVLVKILPEIYGPDSDVQLHPYFASGLLTVAVTTLVLFFASGIYSEKIGYANRYVPHANRALRSFNMYLNVRHRPLRSIIFSNPLSLLFPRDPPPTTPPPPTPPGSTSSTPAPVLQDRRRGPSPLSRRPFSSGVPIAPIPPSANPRGELIFSSRVDRAFREGYERYRAAFERRREERERYATAQTWRGKVVAWCPWNWGGPPPVPPAAIVRGHSPANSVSRGRATGSAGNTPNSSRRSSPVPGALGVGRGKGSRSGTPPVNSGVPARLMPDRTRTESFSFLLSDQHNIRDVA